MVTALSAPIDEDDSLGNTNSNQSDEEIKKDLLKLDKKLSELEDKIENVDKKLSELEDKIELKTDKKLSELEDKIELKTDNKIVRIEMRLSSLEQKISNL